jgi:uncharacterized protein (TIGR02453 family)
MFSTAAFTFLRQLARNNDREWFEANRERYERDVRLPMRELVEEMDVRLARIAPEIVGDPKRSMFRIHRDVRFSKDKSPYKTNAAVWFFHRGAGRGVGESAHGAAGFYFHLEPGGCFTGGGYWMPPRPALEKVRERLVEDQRGFEKALATPALAKRGFRGLSEEAMLKRLPRAFAPDHPCATWLRYQSFTVGRQIPDDEVRSATLASQLEKDFAAMTPLVRWLNGALGYGPAERR